MGKCATRIGGILPPKRAYIPDCWITGIQSEGLHPDRACAPQYSIYPQFTLNDAPKVISSTGQYLTNEISSLVFQFVSLKDSLVKYLNFNG